MRGWANASALPVPCHRNGILGGTVTPLTHHDVVRYAAPLVRGGLRIDPQASERAARRIAFRPVVSADDADLHALHTLSVLPDGHVELVRAVAHAPSGLVSTLIARAASADELLDAFAAIAPTRQILHEDDRVAAFSWTLEPLLPRASRDSSGSLASEDPFAARLELQQVVGQAGSEERRVGKECRSRWSPYH